MAYIRLHKDIKIDDMLRAQEAVDDGMVLQPNENPLKRECLLERDGFLWVSPVLAKSGLHSLTHFKKTLGTKNYEESLETNLIDRKVLRKEKE